MKPVLLVLSPMFIRTHKGLMQKVILARIFFPSLAKHVWAEVLGCINSRPRRTAEGRRKDFTPQCSQLAKYPGFAQAEYLSYPMEICRRLAVILKETNSVYPDSMRCMAGLEVGWLCRS